MMKPVRTWPAAEFQRADGPRLGQHREQGRTERRRARVAGLELVQAARQLRREPRLVYAELFQDAREIRIRRVQQLHQEVLDFDVVVRARQAQPGRAFERRASGVIQLGNDRLQANRHSGSSNWPSMNAG